MGPAFSRAAWSAAEPGSGSGEWIFPGECESHHAIWMLWPTYENKAGLPSTEPMAEMIPSFSGQVPVNLAVQDAAEEKDVRSFLSSRRVPLDHVHFFRFEHPDIWAPDVGPQFTRSDSGRLRIDDWNAATGAMRSPTASIARSRSPSIAPSPR
jgi:agmatine/peptidylarginine deiminase